MCAVARDSSDGEKAMAVAVEGSRRAEIRNPVGRSQTRNVESRANPQGKSRLMSGKHKVCYSI